MPIGGANSPKGCLLPFEDSKGRLWLAGCETGHEGLYIFDGTRFISIQSEPGIGAVDGMAEDSQGGIWLASSGGVYRVDRGKAARIFQGSASSGIVQVAPDTFLLSMLRQSGDLARSADAFRISRTAAGWTIESVLSGTGPAQFRLDRSGNILFGCEGGYCEVRSRDVVEWQPGKQIPVNRHEMGIASRYAGMNVAVLRDRLNCLWFRSVEASYECPGDAHPITLPGSMVGTGYPQIFELSDGSIAIPSFARVAIGRPRAMRTVDQLCVGVIAPLRSGGLVENCADGLHFIPLSLDTEFWGKDQGLDGNIWSIVRRGSKAFALSDRSVYVLSGDRRGWQPLTGPAGRMAAGPNNTVIVAGREAVFQMSTDWTILRKSPPFNATAVASTPDGRVWAGGNGLYGYVAGNRDQTLHNDLRLDQFHNVESIGAAPNGAVWVCSEEGLNRIDPPGTEPGSRSLSDLTKTCDSFAIERNGDLWRYPDGNGLLQWIHDPGGMKPEVRSFGEGHGGGESSAHFLAVDHRGWIWRGGADGLYVADPSQARDGQWLRLGPTDGLPTLDSDHNSFFEDEDGSIWYGADNDVIHIHPPSDLVHVAFSPSVFISAFATNGGPPRMAEAADTMAGGKPVTAYLGSLQYDRRSVLHFRYRLLPQHPGWTSTDQSDLPLGRLHWGRHTLQVQAQLGTGPWSDGVEESFTVLKPVWLDWPALAAYLISGGVLFSAGRRRSRRRKEREKKAFPEVSEWRLAALSPELRQTEGMLLDSRFEVGRVIARGGFATVADGRDLQHGGRRCAIKIFRQELADKEWMARRFQQEVLALKQVRHPNVVGIYSSGTLAGGGFYLVMEFIEGMTLRERLEAGKLPPSTIAEYVAQAGSALDEIHRHGICHRDLKPENLMVRSNTSSGEELVLIDFSIAIVKDPDATLHGLSRAAGTIYYMAPEQAIGYASPATDIYSLAKIVIEMLTGQRLSILLPDASMDLPARVKEMLAGLPVTLSSVSIELLSSALEFDPARRPQHAEEFATPIAEDLRADPPTGLASDQRAG